VGEPLMIVMVRAEVSSCSSSSSGSSSGANCRWQSWQLFIVPPPPPLTQSSLQVHLLQRLAFKYYREKLKDLAFTSAAAIGDPTTLKGYLARLDGEDLKDISVRLQVKWLKEEEEGGG